jgi:hypothetical protein
MRMAMQNKVNDNFWKVPKLSKSFLSPMRVCNQSNFIATKEQKPL